MLGEDLLVGKSCSVEFENEKLGTLVVSVPWFHASRTKAAYQAMDNATGIGVEIHYFASRNGDLRYENFANCDQYRFLQVRTTSSKLNQGELPLQVDIPDNQAKPYYDTDPLEHGYGTHLTPIDDSDKPWTGRVTRSSTVAIYDTPYVSDGYGIEGKDIVVRFETCAVCERDHTDDELLSCVTWGYVREYMGGLTGWAEPETIDMQCRQEASDSVLRAIRTKPSIAYFFKVTN